jgi:hypothetical protein
VPGLGHHSQVDNSEAAPGLAQLADEQHSGAVAEAAIQCSQDPEQGVGAPGNLSGCSLNRGEFFWSEHLTGSCQHELDLVLVDADGIHSASFVARVGLAFEIRLCGEHVAVVGNVQVRHSNAVTSSALQAISARLRPRVVQLVSSELLLRDSVHTHDHSHDIPRNSTRANMFVPATTAETRLSVCQATTA